MCILTSHCYSFTNYIYYIYIINYYYLHYTYKYVYKYTYIHIHTYTHTHTHTQTYVKIFPGGSDGKESACNAWDLGSVHGLGRSPGEGNDNPL